MRLRAAAILALLAAPAAAQVPAVCAGEAECRVVRTHDAGSDPAGRRLAVIETALGTRNPRAEAPLRDLPFAFTPVPHLGVAAPAEAPREWLRALVVGDRRTEAIDLLVSVDTRRWTRGARNWIHDDHIKIWFSGQSGYGTQCYGGRPKLAQWAIGIAHGVLRAGHGRAALLRDAP